MFSLLIMDVASYNYAVSIFSILGQKGKVPFILPIDNDYVYMDTNILIQSELDTPM